MSLTDKFFEFKNKIAYTLAEVVIVMLIIAVVVGVCIKISKVKMDNILKVSYYVSYDTLKTITTEMFKDITDKKFSSADEVPADCFIKVSGNDESYYCLYNGKNFCEKFIEYANTSPSLIEGGEECKGDDISSSLTDFSAKKPDTVLRNGMILYSMSKDPVEISVLKGNSREKSGTKTEAQPANPDGTPANPDELTVDLDEWGYVVYIDIDGTRGGSSQLWEDVYPFYITLSGTLIPAYDSANAGEFGGDSTFHLQTSVMDIHTDPDSGQAVRWLTKSTSFKESACKMGLVKTDGENTYCSGVEVDELCSTDDSHDCKLKIISPVKFFN